MILPWRSLFPFADFHSMWDTRLNILERWFEILNFLKFYHPILKTLCMSQGFWTKNLFCLFSAKTYKYWNKNVKNKVSQTKNSVVLQVFLIIKKKRHTRGKSPLIALLYVSFLEKISSAQKFESFISFLR